MSDELLVPLMHARLAQYRAVVMLARQFMLSKATTSHASYPHNQLFLLLPTSTIPLHHVFDEGVTCRLRGCPFVEVTLVALRDGCCRVGGRLDRD